MSRNIARLIVETFHGVVPQSPDVERLSDRELDVLRLLARSQRPGVQGNRGRIEPQFSYRPYAGPPHLREAPRPHPARSGGPLPSSQPTAPARVRYPGRDRGCRPFVTRLYGSRFAAARLVCIFTAPAELERQPNQTTPAANLIRLCWQMTLGKATRLPPPSPTRAISALSSDL